MLSRFLSGNHLLAATLVFTHSEMLMDSIHRGDRILICKAQFGDDMVIGKAFSHNPGLKRHIKKILLPFRCHIMRLSFPQKLGLFRIGFGLYLNHLHFGTFHAQNIDQRKGPLHLKRRLKDHAIPTGHHLSRIEQHGRLVVSLKRYLYTLWIIQFG